MIGIKNTVSKVTRKYNIQYELYEKNEWNMSKCVYIEILEKYIYHYVIKLIKYI